MEALYHGLSALRIEEGEEEAAQRDVS